MIELKAIDFLKKNKYLNIDNQINSSIGIYYDIQALLGTEYHTRNEFIASSTAIYENKEINNSLLNRYTVNHLDNPNFFPINPDPISWFFKENKLTNISSIDCNEIEVDDNIELRGLTKLDTSIILGLIENVPYISSSIAIGRSQLLKEYLSNPEYYLNNNIINNFVTQPVSNTIKKLYDTERDLININNLTTTFKYDFSNKTDLIRSKIQQIMELNNLLIANTNSSNFNSILLDRQNKQLELSILQNYLNEKVKNQTQVEVQKLAIAKESNSMVVPSNIVESNEKAINNICIYYRENNFHLDADNHQTLISIASQCSHEGGNAVLRARSLYFSIHDTLPFYDSLCNNIIQRASTKNNIKPFEVYPIPANNFININGEFSNNYKISVYNNLQQILLSKIIDDGKFDTISINIESLPSGIYFLNVYDEKNSILFCKKIVVLQ